MIYNDDNIVNYVPYIHNTMLAVTGRHLYNLGRHSNMLTLQ